MTGAALLWIPQTSTGIISNVGVTEQDRTRLGQAVSQRRLELGLSVSAAARVAGIDRATWTGMERGFRRTEDWILAGVERALQWSSGSANAILAGRDPAPAKPATPQRNTDRLNAEIERIKSLPLPAKDRLTMLHALIDLYAEAGQERPEHLAG